MSAAALLVWELHRTSRQARASLPSVVLNPGRRSGNPGQRSVTRGVTSTGDWWQKGIRIRCVPFSLWGPGWVARPVCFLEVAILAVMVGLLRPGW